MLIAPLGLEASLPLRIPLQHTDLLSFSILTMVGGKRCADIRTLCFVCVAGHCDVMNCHSLLKFVDLVRTSRRPALVSPLQQATERILGHQSFDDLDCRGPKFAFTGFDCLPDLAGTRGHVPGDSCE